MVYRSNQTWNDTTDSEDFDYGLFLDGFDRYSTKCRTVVCMILYGWTMPLIGILGLIGNFFSVVVLIKFLRKSNTVALIGMTVLDTFLLIWTLALYTPIAHCDKRNKFCDFMLNNIPIFFPFTLIARTASIFAAAVVSLERWKAVKRPLAVQLYASRLRTAAVVVCCVLGAIIFNIPSFFELRFDPKCLCVLTNPIRDSKYYKILYRGVLCTVLEFTVPFCAIAVANVQTAREIKKCSVRRNSESLQVFFF